MDEREMFDVKAAARKLGVSVQAVNAMCDRGTLQFSWFGGRKFIRYSELVRILSDDDYLRRRRAATRQGKLEL